MADVPAQTVTATASAQATQPTAVAGGAGGVVNMTATSVGGTGGQSDVKPQAQPEAPKGEAKPEAAKPAEAPKTEPSKPEAKAEEVKYDLKLAEGSLLGEADVASVVEFAKANKIAPEVASKILEQREQTVKAYREAKMAEWKRVTQEQWKSELVKDPDIGGDKLPGVLEDVKRLVDAHMGKELRAYVEAQGYLNNKEFIKFLWPLATARRDDKIVTSTTSAAPAEKSRLDLMYPLSELQQVQG